MRLVYLPNITEIAPLILLAGSDPDVDTQTVIVDTLVL